MTLIPQDWPSYQSGIAHRWNSKKPQDFKYDLNKLTDLKQMAPQALAALSPAEKLDVFAGRYDYPTVNSEWQRTSPKDATWEGLCHGWAPASQFYQQPAPVNLTNKDGVVVPFGSSDVKALLTYFVAMYDEAFTTTTYIAQRCNYDLGQQPRMANRSACADMNAGTFHVVIANQMAQSQGGFVVDRDRSIAVWNQPVFLWNTTCTALNGTNTQSCTTLMVYGKETQPMWQSHETYPVGESYKYTIDLDADGKITGGTYLDNSPAADRVDFAWNVQIGAFPSGYFSYVQSIYESSINGTAHALGKRSFAHLTAPHRASPNERPGHVVLHSSEASFGVAPYTTGGIRKSWSFSSPATKTRLQCNVDTERQFDALRVYELNVDGSLGPLLRVLHGHAEDVEMIFRQPLYISFLSGPGTQGGNGVHCSYKRSLD